jgi:uncharacterized membrane protein YfcA
MDTRHALLGTIFLLANAIETLTGFGGTLITLALGAHLFQLHNLILVVVALNVPLNIYLLWQVARELRWRGQLARVLPAVCGGLGAGFLVGAVLMGARLEAWLGAMILMLTGLELLRHIRQRPTAALAAPDLPDAVPPSPRAAWAWLRNAMTQFWLVFGGFSAGLFGSGGPFVVYSVNKQGFEAQHIRGILAVVWLVMNVALLAIHLPHAHAGHAWMMLVLAPALPVGIWLGNRLRHRLPAQAVQYATLGLLALAGLLLVV